MKTFEDVKTVVAALGDCDLQDDLLWFVSDDDVTAELNCSDTFWWGTADSEPVEAGDVALLRACYADLKAMVVEGRSYTIYTYLLFCARKRQMRPQGAIYRPLPQQLQALLNACGPHRPAEIGNPYATPEDV